MSIFMIITIDGAIETREYVLPPRPGLDALKRVLRPIFEAQRAGSHFERVAIIDENAKPTDMFVDDEGTAFFPPNLAATKHYHRFSISRGRQHMNGIVHDIPMIYGTAVVFDRQVWF